MSSLSQLWHNLCDQTITSSYNCERTIAAHNSQCRAQFTMPRTIHNATHNCNQCDFASSWADALRTHLKTHSGEKSNKCNQCDFAYSDPSSLWRHLKTHNGESQTNATNVIMHPFRQAIWGHIWKYIVEKSHINATNVIMHPFTHLA